MIKAYKIYLRWKLFVKDLFESLKIDYFPIHCNKIKCGLEIGQVNVSIYKHVLCICNCYVHIAYLFCGRIITSDLQWDLLVIIYGHLLIFRHAYPQQLTHFKFVYECLLWMYICTYINQSRQ